MLLLAKCMLLNVQNNDLDGASSFGPKSDEKDADPLKIQRLAISSLPTFCRARRD